MHRILIIAPNWIGDAVMSQPLLANLHAHFPHYQIDVIASAWVAPIYRACMEVNEVFEVAFQHGQLQAKLRFQLAKKIQRQNYMACFVLPNSLKSALIPWLAKIPIRIGYFGEMRFGLLNRFIQNPSKSHRMPMVERYLALADILKNTKNQSKQQIQSVKNPVLTVSQRSIESVLHTFKEKNFSERTIYTLCPGAEFGPSKRWPAEYFALLAHKILNQDKLNSIIILGGQSDKILAETICSGIFQINPKDSYRVNNLCGNTTLDEAMAIIKMSAHLVSNDSGLMHIGAALQVNQIAIFGSSDPHHTPPLSRKAKVIWLNLPCSPCHKRECPLGHLNCLRDITPEQVFLLLNEPENP